MDNIYINELLKLAENFQKFWHRNYYEINCRGRRRYKNFNDYYQKTLERARKEQEEYDDPNRKISDEKRKMIRDSITNEKTITKDGLYFIVFTHKMKRYYDVKISNELSSNEYRKKSHFVYNTSVIINCEEKVEDRYRYASVDGLFSSNAKTKPKSDKQFEETCELINNSTIGELMEMCRNQYKEKKQFWKEHFEEERLEKKKMQEENKKELEEIRRKRELEKSKK